MSYVHIPLESKIISSIFVDKLWNEVYYPRLGMDLITFASFASAKAPHNNLYLVSLSTSNTGIPPKYSFERIQHGITAQVASTPFANFTTHLFASLHAGTAARHAEDVIVASCWMVSKSVSQYSKLDRMG